MRKDHESSNVVIKLKKSFMGTVYYVTNPHVRDKYLIPSIIESSGDKVKIYTKKNVLRDSLRSCETPDIVVCDRCTFLLNKAEIDLVANNCFNIHPSLLPYNRGYHPNFWSFYDNTPSGVTIHAIDKNIDSGGIIAQTELTFADDETLKSSYDKLRKASISLFKLTYPTIRNGIENLKLKENNSKIGITHYKQDFDNIFGRLPSGWDTEIGFVRNMKV